MNSKNLWKFTTNPSLLQSSINCSLTGKKPPVCLFLSVCSKESPWVASWGSSPGGEGCVHQHPTHWQVLRGGTRSLSLREAWRKTTPHRGATCCSLVGWETREAPPCDSPKGCHLLHGVRRGHPHHHHTSPRIQNMGLLSCRRKKKKGSCSCRVGCEQIMILMMKHWRSWDFIMTSTNSWRTSVGSYFPTVSR